MNNYKIKYEAAPHLFTDVGFFEGTTDALSKHLDALRAAIPGRYVAELIEAPVAPNTPDAPRRRRKPKPE